MVDPAPGLPHVQACLVTADHHAPVSAAIRRFEHELVREDAEIYLIEGIPYSERRHDMFLAEVVAINADERLFDKKTDELQLYKANLATYSHGQYFALGKILGKFGFSVQKKK